MQNLDQVKIKVLQTKRYKLLQIDSTTLMQNSLSELLDQLPESFHSKALRYKFPQDAYNYVAGRLLLKKAISDLELPEEHLSQLKVSKTGQPMLEGISFSISHSANWVVCGYSKSGRIGADIELFKPMKIEHVRHFFKEWEWESIKKAKVPLLQMYHFWTKKEAVLKAFGAGVAAVEKVNLREDGQAATFENQGQVNLFEIDSDAFIGYVAEDVN